MSAHHSPMMEAASFASNGQSVVEGVSTLKAQVVTWIRTCADYYEAAALFDQLSKLSDADLSRRGLSRATLARDVCGACDSTDYR